MQRIQNIKSWKQVRDGGALNLSGQDLRRVRLDVNAPGPVRIWYADGNGELAFLAFVTGRDVIEFQAGSGDFSLTVDGGECWFQSVDGEDLSFSIPDAEVLTRIVDRRPRNHELELMNYHMNANIERRYAAMREDMEREWARREAAAKPAAPQPEPAGDGKPLTKEPQSAASPGDDKKPEPANAGDGIKAPVAKG